MLSEVEASNHSKSSLKLPEVEAEEEEEQVFEDEDDSMGLSTQQVQTLLSTLCEETDIAEVELKMGSFEMRVRRTLKGGSAAAAASAALAAPAPAAAAPDPAPAPVAAAEPALPSFDEDDGDESMVYITAPKVGVLRRGKFIKGKAAGKGPMVNVGDKVKRGQTLAFVEQLGTHVPIVSPQAGEIASFVVDEGSPVEYNQDVIELAPFFGGHIIGDSKYA